MINRLLSPAFQLSLWFLLFGTIWIVFTDPVLLSIVHDDLSFLSRIQTYKGVFFMIIAAMVIYYVSNKIFKRQALLQQELSDEKLRYKTDLAREIVNAQEAERKKLGEELHDNINQLLGVVKLYIEHAQVNPAVKDEMLKKSSEYLMVIINEIRNLSKKLVSSTLIDLGLIESIREMMESILEVNRIRIDLHSSDFGEDVLSDSKKLMLYRIIQEQMNNVLKHSKAEYVRIELKQCGSVIHLTIQDNGDGFDIKKIKAGVGLKNIQHRLELFNGTMKVESSPGNGCRLDVMLEA